MRYYVCKKEKKRNTIVNERFILNLQHFFSASFKKEDTARCTCKYITLYKSEKYRF